MGKYKVCVYAICKNEQKFINRWVDSMNEADEIYVLDTGSNDKSVKMLKKRGVHVKVKKIKPWRFDVARNLSLDMVPKDTDICVCTDLDEVFEKGWRDNLEKIWINGLTRLHYNYIWSFNENNEPAVNFYTDKIHIRNGYKWKHPVHEILVYDLDEVIFTTDEITLKHYPDKSKSRSQYLELLELSVKESPLDDRGMHYLGREYMYYHRWNDCIDTLIKHLSLKSATWKDERAASMRFIARSYQALNRYDEAIMWLDKAILEAPYLRDGYIEKALLEYNYEKWDSVIECCLKALEIKNHKKSYINEPFSFDYTVYDLLSLAYYYTGYIDKSLECVKKALSMDPKNVHLLNNKKIIEEQKNNH